MPYETKPMKKQWLEVDGRLTPIILPQIWNHELQDWVVTSEQNPLPTQVTGSYVEQIRLAKNAVVAPSTYWDYGAFIDMHNYESWYLVIACDQGYSVVMYITPDGSALSQSIDPPEWDDLRSTLVERPREQLTPPEQYRNLIGLRPRVANKGTVDSTLDVWLIATRRFQNV